MTPSIPIVEITDDTHPLRIRGPHRKASALHAILRQNVRAELLINVVMIALTEQVKIKIGKVGGGGHGSG
jgi:hypothetical protein